MSDFVCIKRFTFSKKKIHQEGYRHEQTRTGFPIELAFVMTAFKGIGDNHLRSEVMVKVFFNKSGVFLGGELKYFLWHKFCKQMCVKQIYHL